MSPYSPSCGKSPSARRELALAGLVACALLGLVGAALCAKTANAECWSSQTGRFAAECLPALLALDSLFRALNFIANASLTGLLVCAGLWQLAEALQELRAAAAAWSTSARRGQLCARGGHAACHLVAAAACALSLWTSRDVISRLVGGYLGYVWAFLSIALWDAPLSADPAFAVIRGGDAGVLAAFALGAAGSLSSAGYVAKSCLVRGAEVAAAAVPALKRGAEPHASAV